VRKQHGLPALPAATSPDAGSPSITTGANADTPVDDTPSTNGIASAAPVSDRVTDSVPALLAVPAPALAAPTPPVSDADADVEAAPTGHLALFNQHMAQQRAAVEWAFTAITGPPTPVWSARALVGPRAACVCTGRGRTKKAAQHAAARAALARLAEDPSALDGGGELGEGQVQG
jgi:hypothetical protein